MFILQLYRHAEGGGADLNSCSVHTAHYTVLDKAKADYTALKSTYYGNGTLVAIGLFASSVQKIGSKEILYNSMVEQYVAPVKNVRTLNG